MKQIISTVAIAGMALMASCGSSEMKQKEEALQVQQRTIDSMKFEMARQQVIDSMNEVSTKQMLAQKATTEKKQAVAKKKKKSSVARSSVRANSTEVYTGNSTVQPPVYEEVPQAP